MYTVGIIYRNHDGAFHKTRQCLIIARDATQYGTEHGALGTTGRKAAYLFVIVTSQ